MKNRGSTLILTNLVGSTQGTSTQNLKQIRAAVREKSKNKKVHAAADGHRVIASHTHSLSVTKKLKEYKGNLSISVFRSRKVVA